MRLGNVGGRMQLVIGDGLVDVETASGGRLPADPVALERLARAMGEPGRQRLLERYRRATRRARRVVMARFWEDGG